MRFDAFIARLVFPALIGLAAPLLVAATPIRATVPVETQPAAASAPAQSSERAELACWAALSLGAGAIVALSRRRRRITTA